MKFSQISHYQNEKRVLLSPEYYWDILGHSGQTDARSLPTR